MSQSSATTLYQIADEEIRKCIAVYLQLTKDTAGFATVKPEHVQDQRAREIMLAGFGVSGDPLSAEDACLERARRQAIPFNLEAAITFSVYRNIRNCGSQFLNSVDTATNGFTEFSAEYIWNNPHTLPILQHLAGVFSKAALKREVGSVSDTSISRPASERLSELLSRQVVASKVNKGEILQRLESTLEGIVRDLVGRVLLESIVDNALRDRDISFLREEEYSSIAGVVYDFRADFVLPDADNPKAFIEVRKSSSRHASLYAKDKMFSAINWKGKHQGMLAVLVVDGEWTGETLRVMAKVFDYVIPIGRVPELADTVKAYLDGDTSKLKWLIEFSISESGTTQNDDS